MLTLYTTCPGASGSDAIRFSGPLVDVARWTEAAGMRGLLVFTDNDSIDPWMAAQLIIERTHRVVPLVAVQPSYMHPYTAARLVSTIGALHDREVDLNLVAGGYKPDLRALGALIGKDQRYDRLVEYGRVMAALLDQGLDDRLAFEGEHYELFGAQIFPPLPPGLRPRTFLAGSSQAAVCAAEALGATRLAYPGELGADDDADFAGTGVCFGVIARETGDEAWRVALKRYPSRPAHEAVQVLAGTESEWLREFWRDSQEERPERDVYWMRPFQQGRDFCPFLVGSYDEVGELLHRYLRAGVTTLILNVPHDEDDLFHAAAAVRRAEELAAAGRAG